MCARASVSKSHRVGRGPSPRFPFSGTVRSTVVPHPRTRSSQSLVMEMMAQPRLIQWEAASLDGSMKLHTWLVE
jgi:hypothetical protein